MKCIFVIPRMGGGGAERVLANLANEFVAAGHDVTIMTIVGGESFYTLSLLRPFPAQLKKSKE